MTDFTCALGEECRYHLPDGTCAMKRAGTGSWKQREIAEMLGIQVATMQHIEKKALAKLESKLSAWRYWYE